MPWPLVLERVGHFLRNARATSSGMGGPLQRNRHPRYKSVVDRLCCFRGFKTQAAVVIATELGDLRRFESPRQLMAYLGLVPSEHSSGDRRRLGAITKAGNTRVRHVLVQAAWHYRKRPAVGPSLRRRQEDQDPTVIAHAWKCQHRLYKVFHRLAAQKPKQVAAPCSPPPQIRLSPLSSVTHKSCGEGFLSASF